MKPNTAMPIALLAAVLAVLTVPASAQVPQIINYQGRVAVGTTNFDGSGSFKFALVQGAGPTLLWKNDGSSGNTEPSVAVPVPVTKGLYSVLLGDTTLANMTAIPNAAFDNSDVRLRVWFDDGVNGSQLLTPDQRIAAVGYAMTAAGVILPPTTSATAGVITQGGSSLLHTYGVTNFFAGPAVGNFTMTGLNNTALGYYAFVYNTTGSHNTATGFGALQSNDTGSDNTAIGWLALLSNTSGSRNMGIGQAALLSNTTGNGNTASGQGALYYNTAGDSNTATGYEALESNTLGNNNTASGLQALYYNTAGNYNTASGYQALFHNLGSNNIALGNGAGYNLTFGSNNIDIGNAGLAAEANTIRVGASGTQTKAFVAGIRGTTTSVADAVPVMIDSAGQLGTVSSSRRYKEDIADMGDASAKIQALRPVTFRYKQAYANGEKPVQYGLIAEEVAEIFPELAVFNAEGQPETVKYQDLTPMLLNEVQKLRAEKEVMKKESADLRARLEKIEALILKGAVK